MHIREHRICVMCQVTHTADSYGHAIVTIDVAVMQRMVTQGDMIGAQCTRCGWFEADQRVDGRRMQGPVRPGEVYLWRTPYEERIQSEHRQLDMWI